MCKNINILQISCQLTLFSVAEENAIVIAQYKNHTSNFTRQINMKPSLEEIMKDKVRIKKFLINFSRIVFRIHFLVVAFNILS